MTDWADRAVERDALLARFRIAVDDGTYQPDGQAEAPRSAIACMIGSDDAATFAERSGFPEPLTMMMAQLAQLLPRAESAEMVVKWLTAADRDADLGRVGDAVMHDWLSSPEIASRLGCGERSRASLSQLISLHASAAAGAFPPKSEWRATRKGAVALADAQTEDERVAGRALEALAWPVSDAPEILVEMIWIDLETRQAIVAAERDMPPKQPGDDDLFNRLFDEQIAGGLEEGNAFREAERIMNEIRPDLVLRAQIMNEIMSDIQFPTARMIGQRVVDKMRLS